MTEPSTTDANQGGAVATAPASSEGANNATGSTTSTSPATPQVDGTQGDTGNSGQGDAGNGAGAEDDDRSRPPRAERRISELNKLAGDQKKRADDAEAENERLRSLLGNPIDEAKINLQLPDYSKQESVTPQQIAADVKKASIDAADQIVKIRLGQLLPEAFKGQDLKAKRDTAVSQLREVGNSSSRYYHAELDPDSEKYEPETDAYLAKTFERVFKADPTYTFRELVSQHFKQRGGRGQTNTNEGTSAGGKTPPAATALRGNAGNAAKGHKPIAEMSANEYRDYLKTRK